MKMSGLQTSKFKNMFSLTKVVLSIIHSNTKEESLFSQVRKNLTAQRASLALDRTLSSIMTFQLNCDQGETYVKSKEVMQRSKKVTEEYNKEHSSKKK